MITIDKLEPAFGPLNQLVTINGSGFTDHNVWDDNEAYVLFGTVQAQIASWADTKIEASFPAGSQTDQDTVLISVIVYNDKSNSVPFTIKS